MANRIPESTSVEAKLTRWLYMKDVVVIFTVFVIGYFLQALNIVPTQLTIYLYALEVFIAAILLIRPFGTNPKRRSLRVFMLTITKDRNTYEEIPYSIISKIKEGKENAVIRKQSSYKDFLKKEK
ncbi:hypothetical protein KND94_001972 [Staphylococcus pseudintermedius]|uniref:DUF5592 family protein n=1 Tax=Staphylococcus pseudintermedius TaxID=283734 RepID=UPI001A09FF88|nr:DUF5592 family protein [Staphylococcus pseudintermedius]HEC2174158.1 hypothetical protein [Staphylococcus delphini]EGQ3392013.1 hypothetical protein [Staphylococcus pseudintermedius]EGQ4238845.1 hypothetical protein [Staphylococcus pseudintermedius]EHP0490881.1 hypothetical protein [Staphylococcus pseudintermedius]WMZ54908.1 DUF5592 family protein [Staphylococcus pseudintermedius]